MDSIPRRWTLKPLSPLLQPSDLRTIAGPAQVTDPTVDDLLFSSNTLSFNGIHSSEFISSRQDDGSQGLVIQTQQIMVSTDGARISNEWQTSSASSPSSPSSSMGSHSGFYSFVEDPESHEAEQNEAWMVSPQRQNHLLTLKEEKGFKLQTYTGSRKPESLFSASQEDSLYKVDPQNGIHVVGEEEEKQLRKEIIHSQAPKTNPVFKDEQLQALENLDLSRSPYGLSYSPVKPGRLKPPLPAEPGTVDKEQINFSAARQQFLKMEQDQQAAFLDPRWYSKTHLSSSSPQDSHVFTSWRVKVNEDTIKMTPSEKNKDDPEGRTTEYQTEGSLSGRSSVFDDLDSGLEDLVLGGDYTSDDCVCRDNTPGTPETRNILSTPETPIEREIRLVQEREVDLRRSRGLKHTDNKVEMVEIKTKRLDLLTPIKAKEKTRVSFVVQRELQKERECKKGPDHQVEILGPKSADLSQHVENKRSDASQQDENRSTEDGDVFLSPCCPHRHSEGTDLFFARTSSSSPSVTMTDSTSFCKDEKTFPVTHFSSSSSYYTTTPQYDTTGTKPQSWKENLESSGLQSRGQGAPDFIEREIKEALRREQELRELRERTSLSSPLRGPTTKMATSLFYSPTNTDKNSRMSSSSSPTASPLTPSSHRRDKEKAEDVSLIQSTRVFRHKNQRALRWEAGVFANLENE